MHAYIGCFYFGELKRPVFSDGNSFRLIELTLVLKASAFLDSIGTSLLTYIYMYFHIRNYPELCDWLPVDKSHRRRGAQSVEEQLHQLPHNKQRCLQEGDKQTNRNNSNYQVRQKYVAV